MTGNIGTKKLWGYQNVDDNISPVCAIVSTNNEDINLTTIIEERKNLSEVLHSNELQSCANFSSHNLDSENLDIGEISMNEGAVVTAENDSNLSNDVYTNIDPGISADDSMDSENRDSAIINTSNVLGNSSGQLDTEDHNIILNELKAKNSERLIMVLSINLNPLCE